MASQSPTPSPPPTPILNKKNDLQFARVILSFRKWWRDDVVGTVDQHAVIEKRRAECVMSARYMFMTAMSGGIAILGLLLSSPAVVIGAMLLSPLMDPIMGLGFALAIGDYKWLRRSAISLAWGSLMAIGLCSLVVFLSPIQDITSEIASRTRPNLFDLLVAVFSALAGAYAMIRGREGTIVGVAIATALMPPLAVVGFGLATFNWTVFSGALLLYVTNLMAIALIAALMARIYGFRTALSEKQSQFQNIAIIVVFIALAVPLGLSLRQIAWEANAARQVRGELVENFGSAARLSQPEINFDGEPLQVSAFVWTTQLKPDAETKAEANLTRDLGRKVDIDLKQFLVRDEQSAEQAQLTSAKEQEEAAASQRADALAARLALMAGVEESEVMVDRQRRRAMVKAVELEGAPLATYFDLEQRIAATEPDWRVELIPPAKALPTIAFDDGEPTEAGMRALALIAWSSGRVGAPVVLSGPAAAVELAQKELAAAGVQLFATETGRGPNVTAKWGSVER
ncbi:DUF389 domain-containing protein [Pontixanthobacter aestiaquae]|uniref:DUF389 domain-containing protein n=1 Tax=Pontixanthobacter aestiaquae TaxID=1509367 RepID=A0A844Z6N7_9SPHN|nr:DUF389 domain-containing protein [Pontixanthobacter aestiaquae]MDN3646272.1 DUF389 domain-containing protein [Pontixanthobacter aestiaquae]MXO82737.1 DUF389 domain-containing protein [Pontixanthobacter aestiaquae]